MLENILKVISLIAIFQCILFIIHFALQKKKNNKAIGLVFKLLSILFFFLLGSIIGLYTHSPILYSLGHLASLSVFLAFPICFIYFTSQSKSLLNKENLLHLIPFVIVFVVIFERMIIRGNSYFVYGKYGASLISFLVLQNMGYLVALLRIIQKRKLNNTNIWPNINKNDLQVLKFIIITYLIMLALKIGALVAWLIIAEIGICTTFTGIFFGISFIFVNSAVLIKLSFPNILSGNIKYQTTGLSNNNVNQYIIELENAMQNDKLYLDPLINMEKLSKKINISKNHISQIINEKFGVKYNDYINKYRIEEAQLLIKQNRFSNVIEVAYEVGFNSKSTFNSAFKKITGLTPTQYREQNT